MAMIRMQPDAAYYCLQSIDITIHRQGNAGSMSYPQTNLGTGMHVRDKGKQE
jgi:hypothetical protein